MCFKKRKPKQPPHSSKFPSSQPLSKSTPSKTSLSKKKSAASATKVSSKGRSSGGPGPTQPTSPLTEHTCISDKSDRMQISLYNSKGKKKEGGSGSGPSPSKQPDPNQDSPEVFENAQAVSLHPLNVTQIFVDSVVPQTNVSKMHTDVIDQNTLENVDLNIDDQIFPECDSEEERNPEMPQPRPPANVLRPEDETLDDTFSGKASKTAIKAPSERRYRTARAPHHPTTPDRNVATFTPPPPTKSEKPVALHTGKRTPRGGVSTRTTMTARVMRSPGTEYRHVQQTQRGDAPKDATITSKEGLTQRTARIPSTVHTVHTAAPMDPKDNTCPSREPVIDTATATQTNSNLYTAHMSVFNP